MPKDTFSLLRTQKKKKNQPVNDDHVLFKVNSRCLLKHVFLKYSKKSRCNIIFIYCINVIWSDILQVNLGYQNKFNIGESKGKLFYVKYPKILLCRVELVGRVLDCFIHFYHEALGGEKSESASFSLAQDEIAG